MLCRSKPSFQRLINSNKHLEALNGVHLASQKPKGNGNGIKPFEIHLKRIRNLRELQSKEDEVVCSTPLQQSSRAYKRDSLLKLESARKDKKISTAVDDLPSQFENSLTFIETSEDNIESEVQKISKFNSVTNRRKCPKKIDYLDLTFSPGRDSLKEKYVDLIISPTGILCTKPDSPCSTCSNSSESKDAGHRESAEQILQIISDENSILDSESDSSRSYHDLECESSSKHKTEPAYKHSQLTDESSIFDSSKSSVSGLIQDFQSELLDNKQHEKRSSKKHPLVRHEGSSSLFDSTDSDATGLSEVDRSKSESVNDNRFENESATANHSSRMQRVDLENLDEENVFGSDIELSDEDPVIQSNYETPNKTLNKTGLSFLVRTFQNF